MTWNDNDDHTGWSMHQFFSSIDFSKIKKVATTAQAMHDKKRRAAERLMAELSAKEKETQMSRTEEMQQMKSFIKDGGMPAVAKYILETGSTSLNEYEYTELVQEESKRKGISFEKAFQDPDTQRAYAIVREAGHVQTYLKSAGFPNVMSVEPVVTGGKDAMDVNSDSSKAIQELTALAEKQHISFEQAALNNPAIMARTYTSAHRPNISSTSGSELQRSRPSNSRH
jgi:hypothetical protein